MSHDPMPTAKPKIMPQRVEMPHLSRQNTTITVTPRATTPDIIMRPKRINNTLFMRLQIEVGYLSVLFGIVSSPKRDKTRFLQISQAPQPQTTANIMPHRLCIPYSSKQNTTSTVILRPKINANNIEPKRIHNALPIRLPKE